MRTRPAGNAGKDGWVTEDDGCNNARTTCPARPAGAALREPRDECGLPDTACLALRSGHGEGGREQGATKRTTASPTPQYQRSMACPWLGGIESTLVRGRDERAPPCLHIHTAIGKEGRRRCRESGKAYRVPFPFVSQQLAVMGGRQRPLACWRDAGAGASVRKLPT